MSGAQFTQLDHFEIAYIAGVKHKPDERPLFLPSVIARGSGVDMQQRQLAVILYAEDMTVAGDHKLRARFGKHAPHSGSIATGVAADVSHPDLDALDFEAFDLRTAANDLSAVDVASDSPDDRSHSLKACNHIDVTDITGMPDFVA